MNTTLKLRIFSDIHLEFGDYNVRPQPSDHETVLVLAGDIGIVHKASQLEGRYGPFLERCSQQFRHVVLVMGNHEHTSSKLIRFGLPLKQWFTNGGGWLSELYDDIEVFNQTKKMIVSYASMLPYAITVYHHGMRIGVVHAEVDYEAPHWNVFRDSLEAENSFVVESALWSREIINCPERFDKPEFRVKWVDSWLCTISMFDEAGVGYEWIRV